MEADGPLGVGYFELGEVLLPVQWHVLTRTTGEGHARLLVALMRLAINSIARGRMDLAYQDTTAYVSDVRWVFSSAGMVPFSFVWVCDHLSVGGEALDPSAVRARLRELVPDHIFRP